MSAIAELLDRCSVAGLSLAAEKDVLHVDFEDDPPAGLIEELSRRKTEVIAALAGPSQIGQETDDAIVDGRDWYEERAAIREYDGRYTRVEAEKLAWGELQSRWHLDYGERASRDVCAGCRRPIAGGDRVLELADNNRVHDRPDRGCLIRHGERWRAAATRGLVEMGLARGRYRGTGTGSGKRCYPLP